jgi:hypothetical protein
MAFTLSGRRGPIAKQLRRLVRKELSSALEAIAPRGRRHTNGLSRPRAFAGGFRMLPQRLYEVDHRRPGRSRLGKVPASGHWSPCAACSSRSRKASWYFVGLNSSTRSSSMRHLARPNSASCIPALGVPISLLRDEVEVSATETPWP